MTEILHSQLADKLSRQAVDSLPGVFLIHGQEMLVEKAAEILVTKLLNGAARDLCCQIFEGQVEKIPDMLAQINTFSMMPEPKIILFKEAKLSEAGGSHQLVVERIIEACNSEDFDVAAKSLLSLCSRLQIDPRDVMGASAADESLQLLNERLEPEGLEKVVQQAIDLGLQPTGGDSYLEVLQSGIEKGFATGHYLIITVSARVPKNLKLFKSIRNHGWIVDCNVPLGERRADRLAQEDVLRKTLESTLAEAGKHLQPGLFETLSQLTGFDLRTFAQNVEKLIDYTGPRAEITADDIRQVLRRTKNDPIFELTNAVADRNLDQSLFYLRTLLAADWYPLQILAALANQIRRLIIAKDFCLSPQGKNWSAAMGYPQFQKTVMPAIVSYDQRNQETAIGWQQDGQEQKKGRPGASKAGQGTDLAPNPKNPYPVYQTLLKSEKYSRQELVKALIRLNQTDLRLKSTGQDASMVLQKTVIEICGMK